MLIVVSAYCPAMLADMHRARMLAWELPALGWEVEVLTPRASEVRQDAMEPDPSGFFAADTRVHEVGSLARTAFEALGSHTHAWRTLLPMARGGSALLESRRFDLVYFTTTTFVYFSLGPRWARRFDVPYVLDFHDPWIGGRLGRSSGAGLRARTADRLAARMERDAVGSASGIVSVSPRYLESLRERHAARNPPWLHDGRHRVIPFGARDGDFAEAGRTMKGTAEAPRAMKGAAEVVRTMQGVADADRDAIVLRYVGVGGPIMRRGFACICRALAALRARSEAAASRVRIELYGTMYGWRPGDPKLLAEAAAEAGVGDLVSEHPERVSYRRSLELLLASDGALILGVDDDGYMPSKLASYALAGKPLLAAAHRRGPALGCVEALGHGAHALWFDGNDEMPAIEAMAVLERFLREAAERRTYDRRSALEGLLAPAMARGHADLFEAAIDGRRLDRASAY